jgi:hypothetical protein
MLLPISARFASSCSRNGINEAEIEAIWFGATSINEDLFGCYQWEIAFFTCFNTIRFQMNHHPEQAHLPVQLPFFFFFSTEKSVHY